MPIHRAVSLMSRLTGIVMTTEISSSDQMTELL
jgi:hypothetical protein